MTSEVLGANLGLHSGWSPSDDGWSADMNKNLRFLDGVIMFATPSLPLATPPGSPAEGDRYIIAASATGAWSGKDGSIVGWQTDETGTAGWRFYTPKTGWVANVITSGTAVPIPYIYQGGTWSVKPEVTSVLVNGTIVAATSLNVGAGVTASLSGTVLTITAATGTVSSIATDAGLAGGPISTSGTISLATITAGSLMGNGATIDAVPAAVTVGTNLSLNAGNTLNAMTGSGTVTSIITGAGLTGGPITGTGTISFAAIAAGNLVGNPGTASAVPSAVVIGTGLSLTVGGTLNATGTGTVTSIVTGGGLTGGPITGSGTISVALTAAGNLVGNPGTTAAAAGSVVVGAGLSLTVGGTLNATGTGTVTSVISGAGLATGTITGTGTINLATTAAGSLVGNPGTAAAVAGAVTVGAGLTLSATGTLSGTAPTTLAGDSDVNISSPTNNQVMAYSTASSKWVNHSEPYIVGGGFAGTLSSASQVVVFHRFTGPVSFPVNFGTANSGYISTVASLINSASACAFLVQKCAGTADPTSGGNWSTVGTISFGATAHLGTLVTTGTVALAFAQLDYGRVLGPGTADTALATVTVSLVADRT